MKFGIAKLPKMSYNTKKIFKLPQKHKNNKELGPIEDRKVKQIFATMEEKALSLGKFSAITMGGLATYFVLLKILFPAQFQSLCL